ncbi:MAG: hypothetical protein HY457_00575 [Parcubacteria group bacterium]|nr:hypothetical protein [Parcubacteria group bacterium]
MHPESLEAGKEKPLHTFPRGKEFLTDAQQYVREQGVEPISVDYYYLKPGNAVYDSFLAFFIQELERLPFRNEAGKTLAMRDDAEAVVQRLVAYLKKKQSQVLSSVGGRWLPEDISQIEDIFQGWLEVFKNEIYEQHGIEGVGYNVDLSAFMGKGGRNVPAGIRIERRYVTTRGGMRLVDNGFFELSLSSGALKLDLQEGETGNVHTGE